MLSARTLLARLPAGPDHDALAAALEAGDVATVRTMLARYASAATVVREVPAYEAAPWGRGWGPVEVRAVRRAPAEVSPVVSDNKIDNIARDAQG